MKTQLELPWDWLCAVFGKRELMNALRRAVTHLAAPGDLDERAKDALALASQYAEGWRPDDNVDG